MRHVRVAVTVAGSDSIGGAGIQADLKTFASSGVYGTAAVTAITAQNTFGVTNSVILPGRMVYDQLKAIADDSGIDAGKTGMLGNEDVVESVVKFIKEYEFSLVVDPVMIAKSGARLLSDGGIEALKNKLIPQAFCVTPNTEEVEILTGMKIRDADDMVVAGEKIVDEFGCASALVKGGHLKGKEVVDVLCYNGKVYEFKSERKEGCFHGTGCMLSAGIAANLALGKNILEAVEAARNAVYEGIIYSVPAGRKCDSVNSIAVMERRALAYRMIQEMNNAIRKLENLEGIESLIPEVGMNLVYAMPFHYSKTPDDVLAVEGRIFRGKAGIVHSGRFEFGASRHLARAVLRYMMHYPDFRSAINLRYSDELVEKFSETGFAVSFYDRREEPEEIKRKEGATIPWGIGNAIEKSEVRPDVIYHSGDYGKEPVAVVFGRNPSEVVEKVSRLFYG